MPIIHQKSWFNHMKNFSRFLDHNLPIFLFHKVGNPGLNAINSLVHSQLITLILDLSDFLCTLRHFYLRMNNDGLLFRQLSISAGYTDE
jgi:hypothetical protein